MPESVLTWIDAGRPTPAPPAVQQWLSDAQNAAFVAEFAQTWELAQAPEPPEGGLEDLRMRLREEQVRVGQGDVLRLRLHEDTGMLSLRRIAASIALVGLGFLGVWFGLKQASEPGGMQQVIVPAAASATIELPGDIVIDLNAESRLSYRTVKGEVAEVELQGEGFFRVPHDPKRQFIVRTEAGVVRDLGTDFNVRVRDGELAVAVASGIVALENAGQAVEVRAGESARARLGAPPATATEADIDALVGWRTGRLVFVDESLGAIAAELSRKYGMQITVAPSLATTRITATVVISADAVEALRTITLPAGARYTRTSSGWDITPQSGR